MIQGGDFTKGIRYFYFYIKMVNEKVHLSERLKWREPIAGLPSSSMSPVPIYTPG